MATCNVCSLGNIKDHQLSCGSSVTPVERQAPVLTARLLLNYLPHTPLVTAGFLQHHRAECSMLTQAQSTAHKKKQHKEVVTEGGAGCEQIVALCRQLYKSTHRALRLTM